MFWRLEEARLRQFRGNTSAANALSVSTAPCPEGKVWVILACGYTPSVAETKSVCFVKIVPGVGSLALINPSSLLLNPAYATFIEQGMEVLLFPGEYIQALRDSATAGSTMSIYIQHLEIDLPLYTYDEPQVVKRQVRGLSSIRERLGGGFGGGRAVGSPTLTGERGGRTGPLPK